jgi:nitrile hydratase subunit beta
MDGVHDLGGRQGFGPVVVEPDEPVFHQPWEATARALTMLVAGAARVSGGEFRHSIERMDPTHYLTSSYYEHWLTAAATMAVEHGLTSVDELEERAGGAFPLSHPARPGPTPKSSDPEPSTYAVGDRVLVADRRPTGHTRCPWYVRGRVGTVERLLGDYSLPDVEAHGPERVEEPVYTVRFPAAALWDDAEPGVTVHVDLWDRYLEAAG